MSSSVMSDSSVETISSVLRWVARISSIASIGLLGLFLFGGNEPIVPSLREATAMLFFPLGVVVGMIAGWKSELVGGTISAASLALFYAVMFAMSGKLPGGAWFLIFTAPGLLFLLCGLFLKQPTDRKTEH